MSEKLKQIHLLTIEQYIEIGSKYTLGLYIDLRSDLNTSTYTSQLRRHIYY